MEPLRLLLVFQQAIESLTLLWCGQFNDNIAVETGKFAYIQLDICRSEVTGVTKYRFSKDSSWVLNWLFNIARHTYWERFSVFWFYIVNVSIIKVEMILFIFAPFEKCWQVEHQSMFVKLFRTLILYFHCSAYFYRYISLKYA